MTLPMFPVAPSGPRTVTLVRLAGEIARSLAPVGRVSVEGEVYRPTRTGGGRIYFTLRDRAAQMTVTCPQGRAARCRAIAGERVCVVGAVSWISERGDLQLVAEAVTPVGDGAVAAMIAEARRRLEVDGLLDRPRRSIPLLPRLIGVVCGADSAVRKDIESVVAARFPGYPLRVVETFLSGPSAALSIMDALARLAADDEVDVIVLARGGGDATQLLPFSDEELCRAVCDCPVPVVSAIGHEGDRPLCDEVADLRCATPLAAAAAVVPDRQALRLSLAARRATAAAAFERHTEVAARRLAAIDTGRAVRQGAGLAGARLDRLGDRLSWVHPRGRAEEASRRLASIDRHGPAERAVATGRARLGALEWRRGVHDRVARAEGRLEADARHLQALSPQRVLERGYAVARDAAGGVIRQADQVAPGALIDVQVAAGRMRARVEQVVSV
ncbi:MAG: exodeoxyribonuclease large subunit [Acidimicrobiaceae bacterium]|nr:exodeoxyribonuclease large subunit [Acidimicrobiaceae bacterium]